MTNIIEEIADPKTNNIVKEYFRLHSKYVIKYGHNTLLFIQVGSFHEAYQTLSEGPNLRNISDILNIVVTKKNKLIEQVNITNPMQLGFPSITVNKYVKMLVDAGYTVVIGDQITPPPNPKRAITNIYSPGTYIEEQSVDNCNIISIYIEMIDNLSDEHKIDKNYIIGLSIIDLTTGKSIIHELYSVKNDIKICLDETVRIINSYSAKEILIYAYKINNIDEIVAYLELTDKLYHIKQLDVIPKISYQTEVLKKVFPQTNSVIEALDLEKINYGRIAYVLLLLYCYDHSHNIINNLSVPIIYANDQCLNLGNNAVFQLNLLTYDRENLTNIYTNTVQYKSLFDVVNKTSTPMGRRFLKERLVQPLINTDQINNCYKIIKKLIVNDLWKKFEEQLVLINDIERYQRKIEICIINPIDFYNFIESLSNCVNVMNEILLNDINIDNINIKTNIKSIIELLTLINKKFKIDELQKYLINDISGPIFNEKIYQDIDKLNNKINKCTNYMDAISTGLSNFLDSYLHTGGTVIKVDYTDRDGHYLVLTKRRADVLERLLEEQKEITFNYNNIEYTIKQTDIEFRHLPKGNNSKIFIPGIKQNSDQKLDLQDELKQLQKQYYVDCLGEITHKYSKILTLVVKTISLIDFLKSGAKLAIKNHYSIPKIINDKDKSYLIAQELRHPIIELINTTTEYIPTDIKLGTENQDGILLFGLNSSGKSSLQKSIGIAIIMAQMGYPVAAKKFTYYPYNSLYTRISGCDNLFKGLSSFALEISELRSIIKRHNQNTLVIADEVCKGTEHKSSLIIVMTMLEILSASKTSFITATHLHDLTDFDRLKKLTNIKLYHLHIEYDEKNNTLKYDRKLKEGSGDNFYGLNVAKYLMTDDKFMNIANEIKKEIFMLSDIVNNKTSKYNTDLYVDHCQICGLKPKKTEIPLETHHILFQKDFKNGINDNKFHVQKNQKSNLVILCRECHDKIDQGKLEIKGWKDEKNLDWNYLTRK